MNKRYLWVASALLVLAGCAKSFEPAVEPEPATNTKAKDPWVLQDLSSQMKQGPAEKHVLQADFAGTRSTVAMNEAGTSASSVWSAGDSFDMYALDASTQDLYYSTFTTVNGGADAHFTTDSGIPESLPKPYDVLYPGIEKYGFAGEELVYGLTLPTEQPAVPGGIADGLALSYTTAENLTDAVHFKSLVSIVRFKMRGSLVSKVKKVSIKGTSPLAGDAIGWPDGEGSLEVMQDIGFSGDIHSRTVTLAGDFVAGQDYFIVLFPGTQSSFQMIFSDGEGHSTSKKASEFTFPCGGILDFGTVDIGDEFTDETGDTTPILYNQASADVPKPVTIAVIPEGFMASELDTYEMLAKSAMDALMATEPFNHYREYFNIWILKAASNESGASITDGNGNVTTRRDTYFGAGWGAGDNDYGDMSADEDVIFDFVSENCPDVKQNIHPINEVPILMIINDSRYGGICQSWSDGTGYCMAPVSYDGGTLMWGYPETEAVSATASASYSNMRQVTDEELEELGINIGDWRNTVVHEFGGHCFSRLGDEYWYESWSRKVNSISEHRWPVPYSLNISASATDPGWKADLLDDDLNALSSLTEKDSRYGRIGVFQGAAVSMFNRWRSERVSCMIDNRFYFSTWQRMIIVKRIMTLCGGTFDTESFWAKDDPTDPVRDRTSGSTYGRKNMSLIRTVPTLPPPVLHENSVEIGGAE